MSNVAIVVLADRETRGGSGCVVNALKAPQKIKAARALLSHLPVSIGVLKRLSITRAIQYNDHDLVTVNQLTERPRSIVYLYLLQLSNQRSLD